MDKTILFKLKKKLEYYGEISFELCAPSILNALPRDIREIESPVSFKRALKHSLFLKAFDFGVCFRQTRWNCPYTSVGSQNKIPILNSNDFSIVTFSINPPVN